MGTKLRDIVIKQDITIEDLKNKSFVVDSSNMLYQFLSTIRMRDGSPLMDSHGNITSHLNGLFYRTTKLMSSNLKLAFVFDGKPPALKKQEREKREARKQEAVKAYEIAKEREDLGAMKKYASRTSRLTFEMVDEAKKLVKALGLPVIQAPSEGEAQAAMMVQQKDAYAEISQDYDCLVFGVPRLVRNLTVSEKRKLPSKLAYEKVTPELLVLQENLDAWKLNQDQLIVLAILIGTDYDPGGVPGIGPKKALKLLQDHKADYDKIFKEVKWGEHWDIPWEEVFKTFKEISTTKDYVLTWKPPQPDVLRELLCEEHDFAEDRVNEVLKRFESGKTQRQQKGLGDFL